jgi:hypothetical protein
MRTHNNNSGAPASAGDVISWKRLAGSEAKSSLASTRLHATKQGGQSGSNLGEELEFGRLRAWNDNQAKARVRNHGVLYAASTSSARWLGTKAAGLC